MTGARPSWNARLSNRSSKSKRLRSPTQRSRQRSSRPLQVGPRSGLGTDRVDRNSSATSHDSTKTRQLPTIQPHFTSARQYPPEMRRPGPSSDPLGLILLRATLLGITLALLVGGVSRVLHPSSSSSDISRNTDPIATPLPSSLNLSQESQTLKARLSPLLQQSGLTPHLLMVDLDSGVYVEERSTQAVSAASVIKVPILVAFLQAVDAGRVDLNESLSLKPELMATGSGTLQSQPVGTQISALQAATMMITISDNTATNLLIDRLGGLDALNRQFRQWGLENTSLTALLPDLEGNNTTTAVDMTSLLGQIEAGKWLSRRSRDRFFDTLWRTQNRTLLPQGLGNESRIAHKTGDIQSMVGDVGIIDLATGQRYVLAILVERQVPNDPRAQDLVQQVSRAIYQYWSEPAGGVGGSTPQ